jgi:hypothetical protein
MQPDATCLFGGQPATLEPSPTVHVCWSCAKRIAKLATDSGSGVLEAIWSSVAPPRDSAEPQPLDRSEIDIEQVFEAFEEGVARQIAADDVDSHTNLAQAYREMGMGIWSRDESRSGFALNNEASFGALRGARLPEAISALGHVLS